MKDEITEAGLLVTAHLMNNHDFGDHSPALAELTDDGGGECKCDEAKAIQQFAAVFETTGGSIVEALRKVEGSPLA